MKTTRLSLTLLAVLAASTFGCSNAPSSNGRTKTIVAKTKTGAKKSIKTSIAKSNKETKKESNKSAADSGFAQRNKVGDRDWNQWAGSPQRNNTPQGENIPTFWKVVFDPNTYEFTRKQSRQPRSLSLGYFLIYPAPLLVPT